MKPGKDGELNNLILVSSTENQDFAQKVASYLNVPLCNTESINYRDSDKLMRIDEAESVRGKDVYLIMTFEPPISERLQELVIWTDALIGGSAERVTIVTPYLFGSRQDRKTRRGEPINVRAYINAIKGVAEEHSSKVGFMTADLHSEQVQNLAMYFDNLKALPLFAAHIKNKYKDVAVISPDAGGLKKAEALARMLNTNCIAWIAKTRPKPGEANSYGISGEDVKGKTAIIIDDMIDSGGTLIKAEEAIKEAGAKEVIVYATHLLLSVPNNIQKLSAKIVGTDTIYHRSYVLESLDIKSIPFSSVFAEAIKRKHLGISTRELYSESVVDVCKYKQTLFEES